MEAEKIAAPLRLRAPAKLNLALRLLEHRDDGYRELQTLFQLIDLCDQLTLKVRDDGKLRLRLDGEAPNVPAGADNLALRAAERLREASGCAQGADISLRKQIPTGAGLGGGSSDAASVLLGLNQLWRTALDRQQLLEIARSLGADVPLFVFGRNAFAEGTGEQLTQVCLPSRHFLLVIPPVSISTAEMFARAALTQSSQRATICRYLRNFRGNDFEQLAMDAFPVMQACRQSMNGLGEVRMSGSGSTLFLEFEDGTALLEARGRLSSELPHGCRPLSARGLAISPTARALAVQTDAAHSGTD